MWNVAGAGHKSLAHRHAGMLWIQIFGSDILTLVLKNGGAHSEWIR